MKVARISLSATLVVAAGFVPLVLFWGWRGFHILYITALDASGIIFRRAEIQIEVAGFLAGASLLCIAIAAIWFGEYTYWWLKDQSQQRERDRQMLRQIAIESSWRSERLYLDELRAWRNRQRPGDDTEEPPPPIPRDRSVVVVE